MATSAIVSPPFVIVIPVPAVRLLTEYVLPFPMRSWPLLGVVAVDVPPDPTGRVPVVSDVTDEA